MIKKGVLGVLGTLAAQESQRKRHEKEINLENITKEASE